MQGRDNASARFYQVQPTPMDSMGTDDGSHSTISIDPPSDTFHRTSGSNRSLKSVFSAVSNITKIVNNVTKVHEMDKIKRHSVKAERDRQRLALNKVRTREGAQAGRLSAQPLAAVNRMRYGT
jgi:hypothetical protein